MTAEATPGGLTTLVYSSLQVTWEPNSGRIVHPASHDAINEWNLVFFSQAKQADLFLKFDSWNVLATLQAMRFVISFLRGWLPLGCIHSFLLHLGSSRYMLSLKRNERISLGLLTHSSSTAILLSRKRVFVCRYCETVAVDTCVARYLGMNGCWPSARSFSGA